jgi:nucleoside-diphosphate-sugar epimerase
LSPRLALTGANGFVGRHLTVLATRRSWEVVGIVRSPEGADVVRQAGGRPVLVPDLTGPSLAPALAGARAAVHLAQIGSEKGGATYEAVNVEGTRRFAQAAREAGVARVVLFSGLGVARYGQAPRVTNRYFLSKLAAEVEVFRADGVAVVFRPSYIVGPGNGFLATLLQGLAGGGLDVPGDGRYRMQPAFVDDAAEAVLAAVSASAPARPAPPHRVFDLVGPEPVAYRELIARVAQAARAAGRPIEGRLREVAVDEADRQARAGGFMGMAPDELDCLLCDEVADPAPLRALLGRPLTPLVDALAAAVRGTA